MQERRRPSSDKQHDRFSSPGRGLDMFLNSFSKTLNALENANMFSARPHRMEPLMKPIQKYPRPKAVNTWNNTDSPLNLAIGTNPGGLFKTPPIMNFESKNRSPIRVRVSPPKVASEVSRKGGGLSDFVLTPRPNSADHIVTPRPQVRRDLPTFIPLLNYEPKQKI